MSVRRLITLTLATSTGCAFNPVSGDYLFEEISFQSDCPEADTGDTGGENDTQTIPVHVNDDRTQMTLDEGDAAQSCALDGRSFICSEDPMVNDGSAFGADFVATYTFELSGTWTGNKSFDYVKATARTCEGEDCETYELPTCSSSTSMEATLNE